MDQVTQGEYWEAVAEVERIGRQRRQERLLRNVQVWCYGVALGATVLMLLAVAAERFV